MGKNFSKSEKSLSLVCSLVSCFFIIFFLFEPVTGFGSVSSKESSELVNLGIEDLMNVEVKIASKKSEKLSDTAGAIYVLTSEEIRRAGVENVPDALRLIPGLYVAQMDSNKWAISSRSPNNRFAGSFLVLVDSRSVYSPLFSGVWWDTLDFVMKDIDRIEVFRGPGAAVWGANAVGGLINIITKSSKDTQGGHLGLSYGTGNGHNLEYRYGGQLENGGSFSFFLKGAKNSHFRDFSDSGTDDAWSNRKVGFRSDWDKGSKQSFRLQGEIYSSNGNEMVSEPNYSSSPYSQNASYPIRTFDGNVILNWKYSPKAQNEWEASLSFDRFMRNDSSHGEKLDTVEFEVQNKFKPAEKHEVVWGIQSRSVNDRLSDSKTVQFDPLEKSTQLFGVFIQDEITLRPDKFSLTLGSRYDKHTLAKGENQPSARFLWKLDKKQSFWAAVTRAVQLPSRGMKTSTSIQGPVGITPSQAPGMPDMPIFVETRFNENLTSQILNAKEIGYRFNPNSKLSLDFSTFEHKYESLYNYELSGGDPEVRFDPSPYLVMLSTSGNKEKQTTKGVELSSYWQPSSNLKIAAGYTWNWQTPQGNLLFVGGFPDRKWFARLSHEPKKGWEVDATLNWVNRTEYMLNQLIEVPAYSRVDFRVGHRTNESVEWSLGVQNALQAFHKEYGISNNEILTDIPRNYYVKLDYTF
ncbi:MAG: TonB-dependent receptor [Candidatus Riflebacteria bacterium]|nr:TonB-dependent receptor [Candidatus Riflebacteria bacterium]